MKVQFETFTPDDGSSFKIIDTPRLNDFYFWHFHPEYELVYIENADGIRHVGNHVSPFKGSDLVLIGSNIPHLNFDYGVKTEYRKVVIQIQEHFLSDSLQTVPELSKINTLFSKSVYGIAFLSETKKVVGERLKNFHQLPKFEQFVEILSIFQVLANSSEFELLHLSPYQNAIKSKEKERLDSVYRLIEKHSNRSISIEEVAEICNLSPAAFCRYFKKMTRLTFTEFVNQYRVNQAKKCLLMGKNVSESCYETGFESLSYFNRVFKNVTGFSPTAFKKQHIISSQ